MAIEEILCSIESLIHKKGSNEPKLSPIVMNLLGGADSIPENLHERIKKLLIRIVEMDKSTRFGCEFYRKLKESDFPFRQEIFEKAVYNENYYNCQGDALSGFLITVLRNNGYNNNSLLDYISERQLYEKLPENLPKIRLKPGDYQSVQKALVYGFKTSRELLPNTVALSGVLALDMKELEKDLVEVLRRNLAAVDCLVKNPDFKITKYFSIQLTDPWRVALTLNKLIGNKSYSLIYQNLDDERVFFIGNNAESFPEYQKRYDKVYKRICNLLNKD
jgi:hypothetical protein